MIKKGMFNKQNLKWRMENGHTFVDFGMFPQTHVNNSRLISKLNCIATTDYFQYLSNVYFRINVYPDDDKYKYSDNTNVTNENAWFKMEPIKWRVLQTNGNKLTLVSEYLLLGIEFNVENFDNDYDNSSIREWLNNNFYDMAFTEEEKERILENDEVNNDNVWLLSLDEVTNTKYGFSSDKDEHDEIRKAKPTDFALATGAYFNSNYLAGCWWLRTTYSDGPLMKYDVWVDGSISSHFSTYTFICIRPSIIIEIE